ncbi:MAG: hypothetical protein ACRCYQ_03805 [Nocardioides sp.]
MTRLQRVFIDTSELFPFTIMDLLLTLSEDFLFTWVWTDELLKEWEEVIVRKGKRTPESAASVADAVRAHFGRSRIDPATYRDKLTDDLSPEPRRPHARRRRHLRRCRPTAHSELETPAHQACSGRRRQSHHL